MITLRRLVPLLLVLPLAACEGENCFVAGTCPDGGPDDITPEARAFVVDLLFGDGTNQARLWTDSIRWHVVGGTAADEQRVAAAFQSLRGFTGLGTRQGTAANRNFLIQFAPAASFAQLMPGLPPRWVELQWDVLTHEIESATVLVPSNATGAALTDWTLEQVARGLGLRGATIRGAPSVFHDGGTLTGYTVNDRVALEYIYRHVDPGMTSNDLGGT
jgi:hypothetical protein